MFDKLFKKLFNRVFRREMQGLQSRMERLEGEIKALRARQTTIDVAMGQVKVGAKLSPKGGSWVVVSYPIGEKDYVTFYDFRHSNLGSLRDFLDKFSKAGMAVRLATPFDRNPPKKGG